MFNPYSFISKRVSNIGGDGIRNMNKLAKQMPGAINLSVGQPDFDIPSPIKTAAIKAILKGKNKYTDASGSPELKEAVSQKIASQHPLWRSYLGDTDHILITAGVTSGIFLALMAILDPKDEVLIPDPYFLLYPEVVKICGGIPKFIQIYPDFQITAESILKNISKKTKAIILNSPNNPTGKVIPYSLWHQIVEIAYKHNILILSDEIYEDYFYQEYPLQLPSPAHLTTNLLLFRGFSKSYSMTGWRLGYVCGPPPIIEVMARIQGKAYVCPTSIVQEAGICALEQDISMIRNAYQERVNLIKNELGEWYDFIRPEGGFYVFIKVPEMLHLNSEDFCLLAAEHGVLLVPGKTFSQTDSHFRLSFTVDNILLRKAMSILKKIARK